MTLLQRLVDYADQHSASPPFHREREFTWQLDLDADGSLATPHLIPLTQSGERGRPRGIRHVVPAAVRTVGVAANLAADDVQYVLEWADDNTKLSRAVACHAAFKDLTRRWAASTEATGDPIPTALAAFFDANGPARIQRPPEWTSKQGVVITVGGRHAHRSESAPAFWAIEVARRKGAGRSGLCLVCGRSAPLLDTFPGKTPGRLLPGASNDAALVSVNEPVFGYQLSTQLATAPICVSCGEGTSTGLTMLLSSSQAVSYGGQDSRLAWWVPGSDADPLEDLDSPDPERVTQLLVGLQRGDAARADDGARGVDEAVFCSLVVGGNVARVMVRDWLEMPLRQLSANIATWFADTEIEPVWSDAPRWQSLGRLALVTGRWQRGRGSQPGRYADFGAGGADRPSDVQRDLLRAAVRGVAPPPSLLVHLLHRICTDGRFDDARAALVRLALIRTLPGGTPPMPGLDHASTDPAYVCGRAFAALEKIQKDANRDQKLNTTYSDRYFAGAVGNPRPAIIAGRRDAAAWLKKLRRMDSPAFKYDERLLSEVFDQLAADGMPARTTVRQQAQFLLGYHHQRSAFFTSKTTTVSGGGDDDAQPTTEGAQL